MEGTIGNFMWLVATSFLVSLPHVSARESPPVNVDDLDPLRECKRLNVQLKESGNKVYMYGGESWVKNGTNDPFQICNHYLRIVDFTKANDLSDSSIVSARDIPGNITIFQRGAFWADEKNLYVVGGDVNDEPWLSRHGEFLPSNYTTYKAGTVFSYSLDSGQWSSESAVQPDSGSQVTGSFCCGAFGYNPGYRRAYYYSGTNGAGARKLDPDTVPGYVGPTNEETFANGNLLTFDTANFKWKNVSMDNQLTTTGTEEGQFVFLPGTESEKGGVAVIIGGLRTAGQTMESMRRVLVYDSAASTFYGQGTTSDGDFPKERMRFCAVAASASDNSSHNIFVYAGESPETTDSAYSDMWILSVPSFRWIKLNVESPAKKALGCTLVGGRYMVTYGGTSTGWNVEGDEDACDDKNHGLRLFHLSSLTWTSQYEGPASGGNDGFQVPKVVYDAIGGNEQGEATQTAPATGFETPGLASLFKRASVETSASVTTGPSPTGTAPSDSTSPATTKQSSNPGIIAGGVIGGVAALTVFGSIIFLLSKRKRRRQTVEMAGTPGYELDAQRDPMELIGDRQQPTAKPVVYEMYGEHVYTSHQKKEDQRGPVEM